MSSSNTTSHVEKRWQKQGFATETRSDPPGQIALSPAPDADELLLVLDGRIEIEIEGATLEPQVGEEVLVPAGTVLSLRNAGKAKARWLYGLRRLQARYADR